MTKHGAAYSRPDAIDPWKHNAIVRRRKRLQRIAREIPRTNRAFRQLGDSARRAADSLRDVRTALETLGRAS